MRQYLYWRFALVTVKFRVRVSLRICIAVIYLASHYYSFMWHDTTSIPSHSHYTSIISANPHTHTRLAGHTKKSKVKYMDIAVCSLTCHTATGTHVPYWITQRYLPPDRDNIPAFTPSQSWYSIKRRQRDAKLSWPIWLVTYRDGLPAWRRSPIQVLTRPDVC